MPFKLIVLALINVVFFSRADTIVDSSVYTEERRYEPSWTSLDTRPLPDWYDDAKVGIFLHWGVYSVPSYGTEWFWYDWQGEKKHGYVSFMNRNYAPGFTYQDFGKDFTTELFDPNHWAELFEASGAKYVVLTSKHHDGYTLWPSNYSFSWNSKDLGAHRDLIGELSEAIRNKTNLRFGLYYSLYEWFNPIYLADKESKWKTQHFVNNKMLPEMFELINQYKPSVFWADGDWEAADTYFESLKFLAWLYNDSPVKDEIVVNDRWGVGIPCKHGDFFSCQDRYNPGVLQPHKWENAMTLDKESWGYRRNAVLSDYKTSKELLIVLAQTISCGGNILINVGPTKEGMIEAIFEERLRDLGAWLKVNGKAVYESRPWVYQNDTLTPGVWFTQPKISGETAVVYAIFYDWPQTDVIEIAALKNYLQSSGNIRILGMKKNLEWFKTDKSVKILLPSKSLVATEHAWVLAVVLK